MRIEVSKHYKEKGAKSAYICTNKEPRRLVVIVWNDGRKTSMSYAKYMLTSYLGRDIEKGFEVDHINNNKMDDRIENYQILSATDNRKKSVKKAEMIECECPVCKKLFLMAKRNFRFRKNPCCSRLCGRKKMSLKISPNDDKSH